jgi:nucleoside-diphosphate-sugar epimerase
MKIFITGVSGFVGGSLANYFIRKGHEVSGIGRRARQPDFVDPSCSYIQADITAPLAEIEADILIHCAAMVSDTANAAKALEINAGGTEQVLRASENVKHLVYVSSSSVYHFSDSAVKEADAGLNYKNLSAYGQSKFLGEQVFLSGNPGAKKTILRPRAIYGPCDTHLLPRLLKLLWGNKIILPGYLANSISLTHIDNLCAATEACIEKQVGSTGIFNIADQETYNLEEVIPDLLGAISTKSPEIFRLPSTLVRLLVALDSALGLKSPLNRFAIGSITKNAVLDISLIGEQLGYKPQSCFKEYLADLKIQTLTSPNTGTF